MPTFQPLTTRSDLPVADPTETWQELDSALSRAEAADYKKGRGFMVPDSDAEICLQLSEMMHDPRQVWKGLQLFACVHSGLRNTHPSRPTKMVMVREWVEFWSDPSHPELFRETVPLVLANILPGALVGLPGLSAEVRARIAQDAVYRSISRGSSKWIQNVQELSTRVPRKVSPSFEALFWTALEDENPGLLSGVVPVLEDFVSGQRLGDVWCFSTARTSVDAFDFAISLGFSPRPQDWIAHILTTASYGHTGLALALVDRMTDLYPPIECRAAFAQCLVAYSRSVEWTVPLVVFLSLLPVCPAAILSSIAGGVWIDTLALLEDDQTVVLTRDVRGASIEVETVKSAHAEPDDEGSDDEEEWNSDEDDEEDDGEEGHGCPECANDYSDDEEDEGENGEEEDDMSVAATEVPPVASVSSVVPTVVSPVAPAGPPPRLSIPYYKTVVARRAVIKAQSVPDGHQPVIVPLPLIPSTLNTTILHVPGTREIRRRNRLARDPPGNLGVMAFSTSTLYELFSDVEIDMSLFEGALRWISRHNFIRPASSRDIFRDAFFQRALPLPFEVETFVRCCRDPPGQLASSAPARSRTCLTRKPSRLWSTLERVWSARWTRRIRFDPCCIAVRRERDPENEEACLSFIPTNMSVLLVESIADGRICHDLERLPEWARAHADGGGGLDESVEDYLSIPDALEITWRDIEVFSAGQRVEITFHRTEFAHSTSDVIERWRWGRLALLCATAEHTLVGQWKAEMNADGSRTAVVWMTV